MLTLADALTEQREKREHEYKEMMFQRQLAQKVLQALGERLAATQPPRWFFVADGDEIVAIYQPSGTAAKERVGSWYVDDQCRLAFGEETTEWVTKESWKRVIDKAVVMTADVILDHETRPIPFGSARRGNGQSHWQPQKAS